ncbi:MAG: cytidine deaminase, partial [Erysipelothrix sp.]|nr:cytidine deaminase [Erysipelothrix sp.]
YEDDKYADTDAVKVSKRILKKAGVSFRKTDHCVNVDLEVI